MGFNNEPGFRFDQLNGCAVSLHSAQSGLASVSARLLRTRGMDRGNGKCRGWQGTPVSRAHGSPVPVLRRPLALCSAAAVAVLGPPGPAPADEPPGPDRYVSVVVVLLAPTAQAAEPPPDAGASGPLPAKLAAVLRRTLAAFGVELLERTGPGAERFADVLGAAEAAGSREKALAVAWLSPAGAGGSSTLLHLLDRLTGTTLTRELAGPTRPDDEWYRAASLALVSMLRSTLADVPHVLAGDRGLEDLVASVPPPEAARAVEPRATSSVMLADLPLLAVEASYAGLAQPSAGMYQNGARFGLAVRLHRFLAFAADVEVLADWTAAGEDYLLTYTQVPIGLTVRAALWPWLRVGAGVALEVARAIAAYPERDAVRSDTTLLVTPLIDLAGMVEISSGARLVLGLRLGFPANRTRYVIWGTTVAEQSPVEVGLTAGLAMDLWR